MEISPTLPIILSSTSLVIGLISLWLTDKRHVLTGSIIYNFLAAITLNVRAIFWHIKNDGLSFKKELIELFKIK